MLKHPAEQCADPFKWRLYGCGMERCHCGAEAMGRCGHGPGHLAVWHTVRPCSRLYTKAVGHDTTAPDVSFVKSRTCLIRRLSVPRLCGRPGSPEV